MSFLKALQHAFIGYGIRRKAWSEGVVVYWDHDKDDLFFCSGSHWPWYESTDDLPSTDWEVI